MNPLFDITEADLGRHVRRKSTGQIGIVSRDAGNGWLHPGVVYEWKGYRDDLEYVTVTKIVDEVDAITPDGLAQISKLLWSAESASHELWAEMDKNATNGEMRRLFARHLQTAYDAGKTDIGKAGSIWSVRNDQLC